MGDVFITNACNYERKEKISLKYPTDENILMLKPAHNPII